MDNNGQTPFPAYVVPIPGEEMLCETCPSRLHWAGDFLLLAVLLLVCLVGIVSMKEMPFGFGIAGIFVAVPLAILCMVRMLYGISIRNYAVTNKRIVVQKGVSTREIRIVDIRAIEIIQGPIEGLFDVGTLSVFSSTGSGKKLALEGLRDPHAFLALINARRTA